MTLDTLGFIVRLQRTETHALGFIPASAIQRRMLATDNYVLIRDGHGRRHGYLLHGPPRRDKPLHIYQACVEPDYRLRGYAADAVQTIIRRGLAAGSTELTLRCALDLRANLFWQALGFQLLGYTPGGNQRNRIIAVYSLPIGDPLRSTASGLFF